MEAKSEARGEASLRLIGLDVGDRRIGLAVSDPTGALASPIGTYQRQHRPESDIRRVVDLMQEFEASGVVIGLPKNMNGTEGPQAAKTRVFAQALVAEGVSVELWDERWSTLEATRRMAEQGHKRRAIQERVDSEAAALILQSYLDHLRLKEGP